MEFWLEQQAKNKGDKIFIDDGNTQLTFKACYNRALKVANNLVELNRTRIGLYINNSIDAIILINAAWIAGIELAMVNTRLTKQEILNQMDSIDVDTIVATLELDLEGITIIDGQAIIAKESNNHGTQKADFNLNHIASIMFTSGTTGPQKAVPQTFANHLASAQGCKQSLGFDNHTVWLSVLPIYHISGLSVILRAIIQGFTVRIEQKFDTQRMLDIIREERPTHLSLVPQTLQWLLDAGLSQPYNIEKILLGGAKLSRQLIDKSLQCNLPIYNSFGMTETCSQFLTASPDMLAERYDTVGKPSDNVQVAITKPDNNGHGELLIKGNNVMNGYLYPSNLAHVFEDGFFNTGDIAEIDEQGYVMVYDRRKDLIISGGENIYPYEIESKAKYYAGIKDAMCIGIEDATWGHVPYLYYVADRDVDHNLLHHFLMDNLAKYKVPKNFERVEQLPYTSTGKLQRGKITGY
ncbi:o-succinylbenzoate--CoA ligase [Staphylococcus sp. 18_1_E_LY]|uniref:2-succinylbenzoate--CoA ligase n=1 Tax=Staphylococcus lloydii TaxID=2781774 RepID=A0A7T1B1N1_9STAP|nr:o-succinylbenzoate--CoA ligase [Staphylococcus lloydii]MBF7018366.1 o-succinylbenzoate--CoA ligase [Staphylococcus lloydii]MBF7026094.1 o-succinylbenzoate--CoA ligase [Staphylococcus lloydii]QPM76117.1 o-succinylbenzoate--CoA ligase [Staphylococcus lloydii]